MRHEAGRCRSGLVVQEGLVVRCGGAVQERCRSGLAVQERVSGAGGAGVVQEVQEWVISGAGEGY